MYEFNNANTKVDSSPPAAPRGFALLLSGVVLTVGALLIRFIYHGPESLPAVSVAGVIVFAIACFAEQEQRKAAAQSATPGNGNGTQPAIPSK